MFPEYCRSLLRVVLGMSRTQPAAGELVVHSVALVRTVRSISMASSASLHTREDEKRSHLLKSCIILVLTGVTRSGIYHFVVGLMRGQLCPSHRFMGPQPPPGSF